MLSLAVVTIVSLKLSERLFETIFSPKLIDPLVVIEPMKDNIQNN